MRGATAAGRAHETIGSLLSLAALLLQPPATATAGTVPAFRYTGTWRFWPGVVVRTFQAAGSAGSVRGDLLDVDLTDPHVSVGLLHPPAVAAREPVSRMAAAQHAVAGVNGDFFNISESHAGVRPTGSAVGPEIADGRPLKAAVPAGQRFGPRPPSGATTEDVIGVGADRTGRLTSLRLTGTVSVDGPLATVPPVIAPPRSPDVPPAQPPHTPVGPTDTPSPSNPPDGPPGGPEDDADAADTADTADDAAGGAAPASPAAHAARGPLPAPVRDGSLRIPLRGLNQYALPVGGVGAFTSRWGTASRARAVCGTDLRRGDPCTGETAEVSVRRGVVTRVGAAVGAGAIPPDTTVLVGREDGAATLQRLRPGDRVRVAYQLAGPSRLRFAVGGIVVLRDGAPLPGLDASVRAARTAAGVSRDGRHLYLLVAGRRPAGAGLTLAGLSALLRRIGAHDAMNLDGGGSSTFALRMPGERTVPVRIATSTGHERAVPNGIGVFVRK